MPIPSVSGQRASNLRRLVWSGERVRGHRSLSLWLNLVSPCAFNCARTVCAYFQLPYLLQKFALHAMEGPINNLYAVHQDDERGVASTGSEVSTLSFAADYPIVILTSKMNSRTSPPIFREALVTGNHSLCEFATSSRFWMRHR